MNLSFVEPKPKPVATTRRYNGRDLPVYLCHVKVSSIEGWVDNPRIELLKKHFVNRVGDRPLSQDEVFEIMKTDKSIRLKDLRDDILKNGLREPLTLSNEGKLLDGNRRFFAIRYILDGMPELAPRRSSFEIVPAYVLSETTTKEDEEYVLVEENFSPSLKLEWPDLVKAGKVIEAYENCNDIEAVAKKFNWQKQKVKETIRIKNLIDDFISFATSPVDETDENAGLGISELEAEKIASDNYQNFNEAQKSFYQPLSGEIEFKLRFFTWIYEGKFKSITEVRYAYEIWKSPEALAQIEQDSPVAAKSAKATVEYNKRNVQDIQEIEARINTFTDFLGKLNFAQIEQLPKTTMEKLAAILTKITK